jgi:cysteinyl-tRNA synthetase
MYADPGVALAKARFLEHMDNDFNTPYALRAVFELVREVNRRINEKSITQKGLHEAKDLLAELGDIFGLHFSARDNRAAKTEEDITSSLIALLIFARQKLRENKQWQLADEIRNRMGELGIAIEDA